MLRNRLVTASVVSRLDQDIAHLTGKMASVSSSAARDELMRQIHRKEVARDFHLWMNSPAL
jgi:hypothetical protein